ncbi:MAG: hypothetical protein FD167_462 [bacterium]|nr:MAG: hypothetical protein FD167_462 [bacterium]
MTNNEQLETDGPWKEILEIYFKEFMEFFFPKAYQEIDWSKGYVFLDKELQQAIRESEIKKRYVDKLVKVWLVSGQEKWVLVHIEVQGEKEKNFAQRIYVYNYRLYDRYNTQVASFVVLADERKNWKPENYSYEALGTKVELKYSMVKLLDYKKDWTKLENQTNPFSIVVMAHLQAQATRASADKRYSWKLKLAKMLYDRNYSKQEIIELFRFIDWIMKLPEILEDKLTTEITEYGEEKYMPYITYVERRGIQQGRQEGLQEGLQQGLQQGELMVVNRLLNRKLGKMDKQIIEEIEKLSITKLQELAEATLDFNNISELEEWLKQRK